MQRVIITRLVHAVIALLAISLIIFALIRVSGDPLDTLLDEDATAEDDARVRAYWGLDKPLHVQYAKYMGNILTGKLGQSIRFPGKDASELLLARLPATLELALVALVVSALIALPLGVIVAVKKDTGIDIVGKIVALLGQSLPSFWLGLMLMWVFAVHLQLLPTSGRGSLEASDFAWDRLRILPGGRVDALGPVVHVGGAGHRVCETGPDQGDTRVEGNLEALRAQRHDRSSYLFRFGNWRADDRLRGNRDHLHLAGRGPPGH